MYGAEPEDLGSTLLKGGLAYSAPKPGYLGTSLLKGGLAAKKYSWARAVVGWNFTTRMRRTQRVLMKMVLSEVLELSPVRKMTSQGIVAKRSTTNQPDIP